MVDQATEITIEALIQAALAPRTLDPTTFFGDPPARYFLLPGDRPPEALAAELRRILSEEPLEVVATAGGDAVLTFSARTFLPVQAIESPAAAHSLGRAIADALRLRVVEPDLPRPAAPVQPDRPRDELEGLDGFPLGCWTPEEAGLAHRPLWALDAIKVRAAWARSAALGCPARGRGVVIAQPDTGVTNHAELEGVVRAAAFNTLGDGAPSDATDPLQRGFALNPGHGTGTASVVVSPERGDRAAIVGSAPLARHLPIRAVRSVWLHEEIPIANAIDQAVAAGAHVITMSLGGVTTPFSPLRRAIQRAVARHVIVMAAAGNCVGAVVYPARFDECLAVAGTTSTGAKWPGSCAGPAVDIAAPAQNVYRASIEPRPEGSVGQGQGTSFAVALTAGVAACWLAHHGRDRLIREAEAIGETLQIMFRRLLRATAARPAGWDGVNMGNGIVDALALIEAPLDLGIGTESPAFQAEVHSPADEMRDFLTDLLAADPALPDEVLLIHGAELAAALLARKLGTANFPKLSAGLDAALSGPARAALMSPSDAALGAPAVFRPAANPTPGIADRIEVVKRSLSVGKALSSRVGIEAAIEANQNDLPQPGELQARLDDVVQRMPEHEIKDKIAFERAVQLLREHGAAGLGKLPDPAATLHPAELGALEAVIKADGSRPSLLVRGGWIQEEHPLIGGWSGDLVFGRDELKAVTAMCGRIQPNGGHASRYCGTGTLIDPAGPWILSNYHVLAQALRAFPIPAIRTANGMTFARGLEIDFVAEADSLAANRWTIVEAVLPDRAGEGFGFVDAVLFRLGRPLDDKPLPKGGPAAPYERAKLSGAISYLNGQRPIFATVGFPARPLHTIGTADGIDWGWVVEQLFGGAFGVKRLAPGLFYRGLGSREDDRMTKYAFGHDATTLRGASGSLLYAFKDAETPAFGLHFAGYNNDSNYAVAIPVLHDAFRLRDVPLS
jgi:serine protease